jgi:hypothetical protein
VYVSTARRGDGEADEIIVKKKKKTDTWAALRALRRDITIYGTEDSGANDVIKKKKVVM